MGGVLRGYLLRISSSLRITLLFVLQRGSLESLVLADFASYLAVNISKDKF
jgi:hypothetical protein